MSQNLFPGDSKQIEDVEVDAPLANADGPCCEYYMGPYIEAADKAKTENNEAANEVYRFLGTIVSFSPNFDTPENPYGPLFSYEGGRHSATPADLSDHDIEMLRELAKSSKDSALQSRIFDLIWESKKDYRACGEGVEYYILTAEKLDGMGDLHHAAKYYQRGIYLASKLGREKPPYTKAILSLERACKTASEDPKKSSSEYLEIMLQFRCGDPAELASTTASIAQKSSDDENFYGILKYWGLAAEFYKLAKNYQEEKIARLEAAKAYVVEAESRANSSGASFMAAAGLLSKGIEALRQAGDTPERIKELKSRLAEYQSKSMNEMGRIPFEIDLKESIEYAQKLVAGQDLLEALVKFAFGHPLTNPVKIREEVLETAKESPVIHLMGSTLVDEKGRPTSRKKGLLLLEGEEREQAIEVEMFSNAASYHWPLRAQGYINPARLQILNDHHPTFKDLAFMVRNNPFVPLGHEGIFLRGIHAGFHGDFLVASHLLVPQIENSLRHVLESCNVDVSSLSSDGLQALKTLGPIFAMPETEKIFGQEYCFEFRGCLIEKTGFAFRDLVAHGFVSEAQCHSIAALTIWWLAVRICLTPFAQAKIDQGKSSSEVVS